MPQAVVLGAGKVGTTMAIDLAKDRDFDVALADRDPAALASAAGRVKRLTGRSITTKVVDASNRKSFDSVMAGANVVLGALSSALGFQTLRWVIEAGRPYCDISFMAEDALALDGLARERGVTAVVDCGVAPGMSNLLAGQAAQDLDRCDSIAIYVGGLPRERHWPFDYKAAFSPHDVIEEYMRPARLVEHGEVVTRPALSEVEMIDFDGTRFPGVGTLEAFNTDGLRTLVTTLNVPAMKEKTMRYPGHAQLMRIFRETGLFRTRPIVAGGAAVRPLDVTSALLFPIWEYREGERDMTIMRVIAEGVRHARAARITWELFDESDPESGCSSMSRTTAYPATIVARLLLGNESLPHGVLPPESLAPIAGLTNRVLADLRARGVVIDRRDDSVS